MTNERNNMSEQNTPAEPVQHEHGEYDTDVAADVEPDFDAELVDEADEVFEDDDTNTPEETTL